MIGFERRRTARLRPGDVVLVAPLAGEGPLWPSTRRRGAVEATVRSVTPSLPARGAGRRRCPTSYAVETTAGLVAGVFGVNAWWARSAETPVDGRVRPVLEIGGQR